MTRGVGSGWWKVAVAFVVGAVFGAFAVAQVAPDLTTTRTLAPGAEGGTGPDVTGTGSGPAPTGPAASPGSTGPIIGGRPTPPGLACAAGRNGGGTDRGVTATEIRMATTVVRSGIGAAFLGDVQFAMEAVRNKVNRQGGICGRQLLIRYVDDGWDASRGAQFLRSFIQEGVFAIPVGPSSEGLRVVTEAGDIRRAGIPVVGTDGMLISQYQDPWIWPVAVATASSARIMAINAYARGARRFAIVFDKNYRFGVEAAQAFNAQVRRLTGQDVPGYNRENNCQRAYCGVLAGQASYGNEVQEVSSQDFDFLAMFLEPTTGQTWMKTPGAPTIASRQLRPGMIGLAQPLFTRDFAVNCQNACHQMWVWTGYKTPIEEYENEPAMRAFVDDLRRTKPDADVNNAFAIGGYVGMQLLVEALRAVGPFLTRAGLRATLDAMSFRSGLTIQDSLRWPAAPRRFAATTMRAFEIVYLGTFGGWRGQDVVRDPTPERGVG
jgi:ABC-type branched-subunit amino acid transport system substrate-binding protein